MATQKLCRPMSSKQLKELMSTPSADARYTWFSEYYYNTVMVESCREGDNPAHFLIRNVCTCHTKGPMVSYGSLTKQVPLVVPCAGCPGTGPCCHRMGPNWLQLAHPPRVFQNPLDRNTLKQRLDLVKKCMKECGGDLERAAFKAIWEERDEEQVPPRKVLLDKLDRIV